MKEIWLLFFLLGSNPEYQAGWHWKPTESSATPAPQGQIVGLPSKEDCLRTALLLESSFPSVITRCIRQE